MRIFFLRTVVASLAALPLLTIASASFADDRYVARAPVLLSPDVQEPWLLQYKPARKQAAEVVPTPRSAPSRPVVLAAATPLPMPLPPARAPAARRQSRTIDPAFLPRTVVYAGPEQPGTIVIDTNARYLYLVEPGGQARRYGVGVGKPGFEWAGAHTITRKAEWPDWTPPPEMLERRPDLPRHMEGGPTNPLGARAMYLGSTLYRIHGTTEPWSIGKAVSSGCIRMRNEDVIDLYGRVGVGTRVVVM